VMFNGSKVGTLDEVRRIFEAYGRKLDEDDVGRLESMLGHGFEPRVNTNNNINNNNNAENNTSQKQTLAKIDKKQQVRSTRVIGFPQLCPECYRPFLALSNHSDEIGRYQFLAEISSFWVFMVMLYAPLIAALTIPALISFFFTPSSISKKDKYKKQLNRDEKKSFIKRTK